MPLTLIINHHPHISCSNPACGQDCFHARLPGSNSPIFPWPMGRPGGQVRARMGVTDHNKGEGGKWSWQGFSPNLIFPHMKFTLHLNTSNLNAATMAVSYSNDCNTLLLYYPYASKMQEVKLHLIKTKTWIRCGHSEHGSWTNECPTLSLVTRRSTSRRNEDATSPWRPTVSPWCHCLRAAAPWSGGSGCCTAGHTAEGASRSNTSGRPCTSLQPCWSWPSR